MTGQSISTTLRMIVDDTAPRVVSRTMPVNIIDISSTTDLTAIPVEFKGSEDADMTGSEQKVHWVMRDASRTMTIGAGSSVLGMLQDGQIVNWTATVDLTNGGSIMPKEGDWIGFYLTGWDAAGNEFPINSNSEASPISEIASVDNDFERQWIRLGAVGAELSILSIIMDDSHLSPGQEVEIKAVTRQDLIVMEVKEYEEVQKKVSTEVNVHKQCGTGCRQNEINEYLWDLKNPPNHINFI